MNIDQYIDVVFDDFVNYDSELEIRLEYSQYISALYDKFVTDMTCALTPETLEKMRSVDQIIPKARFVLWLILFDIFTVGPTLMDVLINKHMKFVLKHGSCKPFIVISKYKEEHVKYFNQGKLNSDLNWLRTSGEAILETVPGVKEFYPVLYREVYNNDKEKDGSESFAMYFNIMYFIGDSDELSTPVMNSVKELISGTWDTYVKLSTDVQKLILDEIK